MINIASKGDELLETRLNKVTNPLNPMFNIDDVAAFCEQVNKETEGYQVAVRLLAHKVQSPQEKEALYAFNVIEECVKRCGNKFHQEIGKFRFLNELIKIISPKYLARSMPNSVKTRCIECLYSLYKGIPHEPKIGEAYNMLKKQKLIIKDPTYLDAKIFKVLNVEKSYSIFDSSKDSERLSKLLKSKNPDDLREANRIIKNIVQEDNQRMEMISKKALEIDTMRNNIKLLEEMLECYDSSETNSDDLDIMKQLIENLEQSRAEMFKLSRETDDNDLINDIIKVIEECNCVVKKYWDKTAPAEQSSNVTANSNSSKNNAEIDLLGEDNKEDTDYIGSESLLAEELGNIGLINTDSNTQSDSLQSSTKNRYDELVDVFSDMIKGDNCLNGQSVNSNAIFDQKAYDKTDISNLLVSSVTNKNLSGSTSIPTNLTTASVKPMTAPNKQSKPEIKGFEELDILSKELLNISKRKNGSVSDVETTASTSTEATAEVTTVTLAAEEKPQTELFDVEMLCSLDDKVKEVFNNQSDTNLLNADLIEEVCLSNLKSNTTSTIPVIAQSSALTMTNESKVHTREGDESKSSTTTATETSDSVDLTQFNIELASIKPHSLKLPMTIYHNEETKIKIVLHFGEDTPHPQVQVLVAQIISENSLYSITDIVLKFAATKPMKVRKQSPLGINTLQRHSPFAPSSPINEILLLFNPTKCSVDLKFQLSYEINGESYLESGCTGSLGV